MRTWITAEWLSGVLDRHAAALELFASQWSDTPEDCVQEAIIELTHLPNCPDSVAAWLFHVVRTRALNSCRSQTRRRRHEAMAARLIKLEIDPANEPAFDANELAAGLEQLDEELREVVVARIWGGLGFTEIGEMLGQSTTTAFRKFQSGLTALRRILEEPCQTSHQRDQSIATDRPGNTK
jgi:RNA polymerase sigma factor (sigma-70 family)